MLDPELLATMRKRYPDVTEREVQLFSFVWRMYPYMTDRRTGAQVVNLNTGEYMMDEINTWMEETYGLKFGPPRKRRPEERHADRT